MVYIEIIGIPGSGKTTILNRLQSEFGIYNKKINPFSKLLFILEQGIISPIDIICLIAIFPYFVDSEHTSNFRNLFKRFRKIYLILIQSRLNRLRLDNIFIVESIGHLIIGKYQVNYKYLYFMLKILYRTSSLFIIKVNAKTSKSLQRMKKRGDDLQDLNQKRIQRYNRAHIAHTQLFSIALEKTDNLGGIAINSNSSKDIDHNCKEIIQWMLRFSSLV